MAFREQLQSERERLGLTQAQAATLCRVSPRVWWKWENGEGEPIYPTMRGVLDILSTAKTPKAAK